MQHVSMYEPADVVAEVKVIHPADLIGGRGDDGFVTVGTCMLAFFEVAEQIAELRSNPEESPNDTYPTIYGNEFAEMLILWERLLMITDVSQAFGQDAKPENSVGPVNVAQLDAGISSETGGRSAADGNSTIQ
jgi:hypothetical protein